MVEVFSAVVVGAGGISNAWFPPLKAEGVEVRAVVDLHLETAKRQIAKYDLMAEASDDFSAMLTRHRPDFVVDLTIPAAHGQVTCTALAAGCHVIGEKPMANSMEEARQMVRASEESGKLYMVSQSRRWTAQHARVCETVRRGRLGVLTTANCDFYVGAHFGGFRDEMASPLILDMAIHHFDLARYFTGADPVAVYARELNPAGSWYRGDAAASCIFEMSNGIVFSYRGSWCAEGCHTSWNGDWRLIGDGGTLMYEKDQDPYGQVVTDDTGGFHRPLAELDVPAVVLEAEHMHGALREMLHFLRTGEPPQTECHDNIQSLAMVFAAMESSARGCRVPVQVM
jgi:predicted dehydrogenase